MDVTHPTSSSRFGMCRGGGREPQAPHRDEVMDQSTRPPDVETVLVVVDDAAVLAVASKVLRRGGYEVLEAGGGEAALEVAGQVDGKISVLLSDVVMLSMNGRELGDAFRERYPDVRIIFMSAYTEDEVILRGIRLAEVDFIPKPFSVQGLRDKVREVLDRDDARELAHLEACRRELLGMKTDMKGSRAARFSAREHESRAVSH